MDPSHYPPLLKSDTSVTEKTGEEKRNSSQSEELKSIALRESLFSQLSIRGYSHCKTAIVVFAPPRKSASSITTSQVGGGQVLLSCKRSIVAMMPAVAASPLES